MALDDVISKKLARRYEFWRCSLQAMERCVSCECRSVLYPLLGLMINLVSNPSEVVQEHAVLASSRCLDLLSDSSGGLITVCEKLVKLDKRLRTLRKLLGGIDDLVVGNAALCMGHCLEVEGAASGLLGTDCVQLLLHHAAGDAKRAAVRQNAAINLGKLCKIEPRHMEKLRKLHGLEILHSCVRLIT